MAWSRRNAVARGLVMTPFIMVGGCISPAIRPNPVYFPAPPNVARVVHLKSFNRMSELVSVRARLLDRLRGSVTTSRVGTPAGIAWHNDTLYVCDTDDQVVHAWNLSTGAARRIGDRGSPMLLEPVDVAVNSAGTIFVADASRGEILAFDKDGEVTRTIRPADREAYRPVAVAAADGRLFVADIEAHGVDVFQTQGESGSDRFVGGIGTTPGRFYFPMGVAVHGDGRVFASDMMNARVQSFDEGMTPRGSFGQPGSRYGDMGKPRGLDVGPDGVVFVADAEFAHVHLFADSGELLMLIGGPGDQSGCTQMPVSVAVAPTLPTSIQSLVPAGFEPSYYVFVANTIGTKRLSLFAVGVGSPAESEP